MFVYFEWYVIMHVLFLVWYMVKRVLKVFIFIQRYCRILYLHSIIFLLFLLEGIWRVCTYDKLKIRINI